MSRTIYNKRCFFFRRDPRGLSQCAANCVCCFLCSFSVRRIEGLDVKDHVQLVGCRQSYWTSLLFSAVALLVSFAALLKQVGAL